MESESLMTSDEVAGYLKVDVVTVRRLVARGELSAYRIGNEYRFGRADLTDYLRRQHMPARGASIGEPARQFGGELVRLVEGKLEVSRDSNFTRRARHAFQLAVEEVKRSKQQHLGTEHVLLGLIREESGVAARVLENLGVVPEAVREALAAGEDWPERGNTTPEQAMSLTGQAQLAIEGAVALAAEWEHEYIGTEHVLFSLTRVGDGNIVLLLEMLGIAPDMVQAEVLRVVQAGASKGAR